jgi:hypothetical protein
LPEGPAGARPQFRLGELLLQAGAITRAQLSAALALQAKVGGRLGTSLIELGSVDERTLASVLASQLNIPSATAAQLERAPKAALALIDGPLAAGLRAVPLRVDGQRLWVAMADPTDRDALASLAHASKLEVRPMVAPEVLIDFALDKHYGVRRSSLRVIEVRDAELLEVEAAEAPVYQPHATAPAAALGFLDERPADPPPVPSVAPRGLDPDALRARLLSVPTDEEVFACLVEALRPVAARLAIFLVRDGVLVAHRGHGLDARGLPLLRIALSEAPALVKLLEAAIPYFGPLPSQLGSVFQELGTPSGLCLPITLGRRAIGVVIGGMTDPGLADKAAPLQRIATMVDLALHAGHVRARLARS